MEIPETRYARSGDVSIAYQAFGEGPPDIIWVSGVISNVEYQWAEPRFASHLRRMGSFGRIIRFDKRGTGLSDSVGGVPTLEQRMDDVRAVLDDATSGRSWARSACRRSSCTDAKIRWWTSTRAVTWPSGSRPRATSSWRASTRCPSSATPRRSCARWRRL